MYLKVITVWSFAFDFLLLMNTNVGIEAHTHMNHETLVFFTPNDLQAGKTMPIYFRNVDPSSSPRFLPREEAESIPFSTSKLPFLLDHFGFRRDSSQDKAMFETLTQCEMEPLQGETIFCATSLESMLEFVQQILGSMTKFRGLSTRTLTTKPTITAMDQYQNFTIVDEPREVEAPIVVACHTLPYPYTVYYCHNAGDSKVYEVSLRSEDGSKVEAIAVCHMDTSKWSHNHVSFQVLGIKPGSSPVCHFFPAENIVWVPLFNAEG